MLIHFYNFEHALELLGNNEIHFYDIPSLVIVAVLIIMGLVHWRRHKKRQKEMEEELEERLQESRQAADESNMPRSYQ